MCWNRCWAGSPVKNLLGTLSRSVIKYNLVVNRAICSNQFTVYVNLLIIQLLISKSFSLNWMVLNTAVTVYLSISLNSEHSQISNATEKSKTPFDFFSLILHICIMDWFVCNNYWLPFVHILLEYLKRICTIISFKTYLAFTLLECLHIQALNAVADNRIIHYLRLF